MVIHTETGGQHIADTRQNWLVTQLPQAFGHIFMYTSRRKVSFELGGLAESALEGFTSVNADYRQEYLPGFRHLYMFVMSVSVPHGYV